MTTPAVVASVLSGIHPPEAMPFSYPWTEAGPEELPANTAQHIWRTRAEAASLGVSRSLGYEPNGVFRHAWKPNEMTEVRQLRLTPETFKRPDWELAVEGSDATARYLGIGVPRE